LSQIFLSHSSRDNADALAMRDWLANEGWEDVFLDVDPSAGLAPGQRWRDELRKAGERCSAVVVLLSAHWAASNWCVTEFLFAAQLGKEIFPVLIAPCSLSELPRELTATYQFADMSMPVKRAEGLESLRIGLQRAGLHPNAFPWPPKDEPSRAIFRGLRVLEEKDAAIFFGRDLQITKALDAIRRLREGAPERMLAILGASGSGKSSFLRAGLVARLKRDTERFLVLPTVRPGRAALTGPTGLGRALGLSGRPDAGMIARHFADLRAAIVERAGDDGSRRTAIAAVIPPTVVLPIDQAEELFVAGDDEAGAAVALIADVVRAVPGLLLLCTIRSDSFDLLQGDPSLSGIARLAFDLPRLRPSAFKEIIEGPTRLPGARIEIDADLTDLLIEDFAGADALPLLAFTLERMIADRGGDGRIEKRQYVEEMKGVGGAIRKAVEVAFATAADIPSLPRSRAALDAMAQRAFVPGLVRIDDAAAAPNRRVALRRHLPQDALPLIDCLVSQRLLVTDMTGPESTVEVSHDAVLRQWPELEGWIKDRHVELSLSERVTAAARDWREAGAAAKQEALVHRGERLRAAEKLLLWDDLRRQMGTETVAYLVACRDAESRAEAAEAALRQRQHRLRQWIAGLVAAAAVVTVLGAGLVIAGQRNLVYAQSLTLARTAERFAAEGDYVRALRLSIAAAPTNWLMPASAEARAALSSNAQSLKLLTELRGHAGVVRGAVLTDDATRILTWSADNTARLWSAETGAPVGPTLMHEGQVSGAVFSRNQTRILTWSAQTVRLWSAAMGAPIGRALTHDGRVLGARFSKDETRILTWSTDKTARLWSAATGTPIGPTLTHDGMVQGALFSKDETRILTWSTDRTGGTFSPVTTDVARIWHAATGTPIGPPFRHDSVIYGAVFSNDETRILTWSADKTARLWNVKTGAQIGPALTHDGSVGGAVFSRDETRILTWSTDKTARLWNAKTGAQIGLALTHDANVWGAAFSNDETRILTWSYDNTARLWNAATGAPIASALRHDAAVRGAVFSKDDTRILTWSDDQTARLWNAVTGASIGLALKHDAAVRGAVFSKDETRIATWSDDQTVRLWNATAPSIGRPLTHNDVVWGAVFSNDASRILTWSGDNTARLWSAATGGQIGSALTHDGSVRGAVFSKDDSRILTWSADKRARLWNAATGVRIGPALMHGDIVLGAAFSKDESRILTWSTDKTARLWDAATGRRPAPSSPTMVWSWGPYFRRTSFAS
jgi:WD40 repeat protein